jgi:hypothetical protein
LEISNNQLTETWCGRARIVSKKSTILFEAAKDGRYDTLNVQTFKIKATVLFHALRHMFSPEARVETHSFFAGFLMKLEQYELIRLSGGIAEKDGLPIVARECAERWTAVEERTTAGSVLGCS